VWYEDTPSFLGFALERRPRHVEKQRLYAMTREGYKDWKSNTTTGSVYRADSGSMTRGMHSMAGCVETCSRESDTAWMAQVSELFEFLNFWVHCYPSV